MEINLPILILELLLCLGINTQDDVKWGYNEGTVTPDKWNSAKYKTWFCDGWQQSPINIETDSATYFPSLKPPMFLQPKPFSGKVTIINDGKKVAAKFPDGANQIKISMDNNNASFCAYHVHWHWGSQDNKGSEHMINGKSSPIEAHVVTYDCEKFDSVTSAMSNPGGLAVFGFLYEITEDESKANPILTSITNILKKPNMNQAKSYEEDVHEKIDMFDMSQLMPDNLSDFYRYIGSLTTPNCAEYVLWTVFKNKVYITREQMNIFRGLKYPSSSKPMVDNYRPVQPLNPRKSRMAYRVVIASFSSSSGERIPIFYIINSVIFGALSLFMRSFY